MHIIEKVNRHYIKTYTKYNRINRP